MVSLNRFTMNSTALMVSGELMTTFSLRSWIEPPNDQISARAAMFESSSLDIPMPICIPCSALIRRPPCNSSSQVDGPFGIPAFSHRLLR
jgi:hypothetical protein